MRINQDMSKSIEKQIDVYTKTREEIRKILQVKHKFSTCDALISNSIFIILEVMKIITLAVLGPLMRF